MSSHGGGESESTKTRPAREDLCLTSDVGKKKQDPLGGMYVSPSLASQTLAPYDIWTDGGRVWSNA